MFRTESTRAGDLRKGDSILLPDDAGLRELAGKIGRVTGFERLASTAKVEIRVEHEGNTFHTTVDLDLYKALTKVCLTPGMQMAVEAFRNAAAEAGIV